MDSKATPRPWAVDINGEISAGPYGETVVGIEERGRDYMRYQELVLSPADRDLIVRAVNAHDDLVAAALNALGRLQDIERDGDARSPRSIAMLEAALAKATGETP